MVADGVDGIEVSGGIGMTSVAKGEAYFRDRAAAVKRAVGVPVMAVAGIRTIATAQAIVDSGDADVVSMSRPFIREPDLIERWERDSKEAKCVSCSRCFAFTRHGLLLCGQDHRIPD
jgi:2,4-dienoyl-CoA reductase-like NADH-dependent reductase (Old Yellow Enzyme family)